MVGSPRLRCAALQCVKVGCKGGRCLLRAVHGLEGWSAYMQPTSATKPRWTLTQPSHLIRPADFSGVLRSFAGLGRGHAAAMAALGLLIAGGLLLVEPLAGSLWSSHNQGVSGSDQHVWFGACWRMGLSLNELLAGSLWAKARSQPRGEGSICCNLSEWHSCA